MRAASKSSGRKSILSGQARQNARRDRVCLDFSFGTFSLCQDKEKYKASLLTVSNTRKNLIPVDWAFEKDSGK